MSPSVHSGFITVALSYVAVHVYYFDGISCACERTGGGAGTGMRGICIRLEMESPHEKTRLLSPKKHELFDNMVSTSL